MKIWEKNLKKLKQFKQRYTHTNVPIDYKPDRVLAQWVENIRDSRNKLPNELLKELNKLNFDFQYKKEKGWDSMYAHLVSFWKTHDHTYIPPDEQQYNELAQWAENQKDAKRRLPVKQIALLDKIGFDWETITRKRNQWYFMYHELRKFKQKFGHTKLVHTDKKHHKLSTWVHNIRARPHQLGMARKKMLDELGFLWRKDLQKQIEDKWINRFNELKEFKKNFGHCNVPIKWKPNKKLAIWVSEQRLREKNKGLLPERKKQLDKIGFSWSDDLIKQYDDHWDHMFEKLKEYKASHGHLKISSSTKMDHRLKIWALSQRTMQKLNMLPLKKQKSLDSIGFIWENLRDILWDEMYQQLKEYKKRFGTTGVVQRSKHITLANWIVSQRQLYAKGKLAEERIKRLNKIGFQWVNEIQKNAWADKYNQLVEFKKKFKHTKVPPNIPRYKELLGWTHKQRNKFRTGKISESEYQSLNKLGFVWGDNIELQWERMFEKLVLFEKQFNHLKVPVKSHRSLFSWISKQKQKHKVGKLPKDKIKKLKDLGLDLKLRWQVKK